MCPGVHALSFEVRVVCKPLCRVGSPILSLGHLSQNLWQSEDQRNPELWLPCCIWKPAYVANGMPHSPKIAVFALARSQTGTTPSKLNTRKRFTQRLRTMGTEAEARAAKRKHHQGLAPTFPLTKPEQWPLNTWNSTGRWCCAPFLLRFPAPQAPG